MRFADTAYFLALLNPSDEWHVPALRCSKEGNGMMVTTYWVLAEVGDALSVGRNRELFGHLMDSLTKHQDLLLLPPTKIAFHQGLTLFLSRPDKMWSLTDCISFTAMKELGVNEALTSDRHFVQAGFRALLRED